MVSYLSAHRCTSFPLPLLAPLVFDSPPLSASPGTTSSGVCAPSSFSSCCSALFCDADSGACPPNRLLFNMTISFSQPFSRRSSAASRSSSSTRPDRSVIDRSRFKVHCFFLTRKRAVQRPRSGEQDRLRHRTGLPEAAVFRRRFSSAMTPVSPSALSPASGEGVLVGKRPPLGWSGVNGE